MGRPVRCAVCYSPNVARINASINDGGTFNGVSKRFDINRKAVAKHVKEAHEGVNLDAPPPLAEGTRPPPADTPEARLRGLIAQLETASMESSGPIRPELARELRMAYSDLAKISQATPDAVKVADVEGLPELLMEIVVALKPFPEARAAMGKVIKARMETE